MSTFKEIQQSRFWKIENIANINLIQDLHADGDYLMNYDSIYGSLLQRVATTYTDRLCLPCVPQRKKVLAKKVAENLTSRKVIYPDTPLVPVLWKPHEVWIFSLNIKYSSDFSNERYFAMMDEAA